MAHRHPRGGDRSRADRMFRRLLRLFPADFRGDFGEQMAADFHDQRRDVLAEGGTMGAIRLWLETVRGILTTAPAEHWDLLRQDVRYTLRSLARNPGFAIVASLALAVGIGANAAVFTLVNGVLIRPLPYVDPDALVNLFEKVPGVPVDKFEFSAPDFEIVRDASRSFTGMFAFRNDTFELSGVTTSQRIIGTRLSPEAFSVLGVSPALGRAISSDDDRAGAKVVVLGHGLWTAAFGRDPGILGRTISLDRQPYTIIGVMPASFEFPPRGAVLNGEPADVYLPIAFSPFERQAFGAMYNNSVVARLRPGVSLAQARAELASLVPALAERYPPILHQMASQLTLPAFRFMDEIVARSRRMILLVMGAVGIVLLIGCVDVANLMLTRATGRRRELAVRAALGASPARVVRQLLTEGLVLAAIGGSAGLLLAWWSTDGLLALAGTSLPRVESIHFDARVILFTVGLSLVTPLVFGVMPALRTTLQSTFDALKDSARAATPGRARSRLLGTLVIAQFALALMLSIGAGLLVRSFLRLLETNPGFRPEHVITASVTLPSGRYTTGPQIKDFYQAVVDAARAIPGVAAAGAGSDRPLAIRERRVFTPDPSAAGIATLNRTIAATWTAGSYFDTLGMTLERGRFFTDADGRGTERVVIVNEMLARRLWPNADPIGRQIKWGGDQSPQPWMTIVGVVGDAKQGALGTETIPQTYEPIGQQPNARQTLRFYREIHVVARSDRDPETLIAALRGALQRLDPDLPVSDAGTVTDVVLDSIKPQRFSMLIVTLFAAVALGLAAIGIYGVLANAVTQQTHEIGVRMALGARRSAVLWWVLSRALRLMVIGGIVGTAGALVLTRAMSGLLYEVRPTDAAAFGGAIVVLAALALIAGLVPAWRATRVDPLVALRSE